MSTVNEKTNEVLNDLVRINNDRIEGYQKAQKESEDNTPELITTFQNMIKQSDECVRDLSDLIIKGGGTVADGSTFMGKIYRTWQDVRNAFSANDKKNILSYCEFGEDAAQKAYKMAQEETDLSQEARILISNQKSELKKSHDLIKNYRDQQKVVVDH